MMHVLKELGYSFHLIFHPFDGFWDLKHEKRGSARASAIILILLTIVYIFRRQLTGFIFNANDPLDLNIFVEIFSVFAPYFLWCIANWCLTTLMDGEGSFKDICIATAYALAPLILINVPLIIMSNIITTEEQTFYTFFSSLSVFWAGGLIFLGTLVTHQYSVKKTILTSILSIVGMGVIIFITLIFFNLIQQMLGFAISLYKEIVFRM